jgi:sugar phosphate isomerase/epimerase
MTFSLSTRWNSLRHKSGRALIQEILSIGFEHVELGYDLTLDLVPGIKEMVQEGAVSVDSVHNFCPVPLGAPYGHPEMFSLSDLHPRVRESAVINTAKSAHFAAEMGASCVVVHCGNVEMRNLTTKLLKLLNSGKQQAPAYDKTRLKLLMRREKKVRKHLDQLYRSLEELLPAFDEVNVRLAIENLPSWESIPSETEMVDILQRFDSPTLAYWHDLGHGQVRQNLGFAAHRQSMEQLRSRLAGIHIHDVAFPAYDHLMPSKGNIDFTPFKEMAESASVLVFEPAPGTPEDDIAKGVETITKAWSVSPPNGRDN